MSIQKWYVDVYSKFIYNYQNLEATKMPSVDEWINELMHIQTMEYYLVLKRNKLLIHEKTWRSLKCILLSKISQSEKALYFMIPNI